MVYIQVIRQVFDPLSGGERAKALDGQAPIATLVGYKTAEPGWGFDVQHPIGPRQAGREVMPIPPHPIPLSRPEIDDALSMEYLVFIRTDRLFHCLHDAGIRKSQVRVNSLRAYS